MLRMSLVVVVALLPLSWKYSKSASMAMSTCALGPNSSSAGGSVGLDAAAPAARAVTLPASVRSSHSPSVGLTLADS